MRSYLKVDFFLEMEKRILWTKVQREIEQRTQKIVKNIRVKKTKNCEKFPLFRAFKKQTKKKLKKCQKQPYFFMELIFLPLLWIIENTLPKRSYLNSTNGEKTKCILCDVNVLLLQFSSENKKILMIIETHSCKNEPNTILVYVRYLLIQ